MWTLSRGRSIHFILDKIDFEKCFDKKLGIKKYTHTELRFIYRHWNQLEKYYKEGKLNFYSMIDGEYRKVAAPWENIKLVEAYRPKNCKEQLYKSFFTNQKMGGSEYDDKYSNFSLEFRQFLSESTQIKRHELQHISTEEYWNSLGSDEKSELRKAFQNKNSPIQVNIPRENGCNVM